MEILFGNKGIYHYMDARIGMIQKLEDEGHMYQVQMLVENNLPYILRASMLCTDGEVWLTHNTKQCYNFQAMLQKKNMDGNFLCCTLKQIMVCSREMELFLLDPADLVVRPEYMFYDVQADEIRLVCIPGNQQSLKKQICELLEYLMPRFNHEDQEGERFLYECHSVLSDEWQELSELFSCLEMWEKKEKRRHDIREHDCEYIQIDESDQKAESEEITEEKDGEKDFVFSKKIFVFALAGGAALALIIKYLFFDGTLGTAIFGVVWMLALIVLIIMSIRDNNDTKDADEAMETYKKITDKNEMDIPLGNGVQEMKSGRTLIAAQPEMGASCTKLIPLTNRALEPLQILPSMPMLTIGREKESDYRVATTQISRVHAKLFNRPDGLYIEDEQSTNGTFVNSERLPAMTERKLQKGDVIGFANEEFFVA